MVYDRESLITSDMPILEFGQCNGKKIKEQA